VTLSYVTLTEHGSRRSTARPTGSALQKETPMPLFLIERNVAEHLEMDRELATGLTRVNADVGTQWLSSFLSADKKKTYCLYEAPSAETIREAARGLNAPADAIVEVGTQRPESSV
jgi:Protein of unknown function (DUF4242)